MERLRILPREWVLLILFTISMSYGVALANDNEEAKIQAEKAAAKTVEQRTKLEEETLNRDPAMIKKIEKMTLPAYKMDGSSEELSEEEIKE